MSDEAQELFAQLSAKAAEGTLDREGALKLLELCRSDEALRDRFERLVDVDRLLKMGFEEEGRSLLFGVEVMERIKREGAQGFVEPVLGKVISISRRRTWVRRIALTGIAAGLISVWAVGSSDVLRMQLFPGGTPQSGRVRSRPASCGWAPGSGWRAAWRRSSLERERSWSWKALRIWKSADRIVDGCIAEAQWCAYHSRRSVSRWTAPAESWSIWEHRSA